MKLYVRTSFYSHKDIDADLNLTISEFCNNRISSNFYYINRFSHIKFSYGIEKVSDIRKLFKEVDILLKINGKFEFTCTSTLINNNLNHGNFIRSWSQIKSEFQLSTFNRYSLLSSEHKDYNYTLVYKKNKSTLKKGDSIKKWSFGIITNGKDEDKLDILIDSILSQNIEFVEIIVCGPYTTSKNVTVLSDVTTTDIRVPINTKKNKIINHAKYQNIVLLHNRFILPSNWYQNMQNYGNNFEVLSLVNIDDKGYRVNDRPYFKGQISSVDYKKNGGLSYTKFNNDIYIPGGCYISKKWILKKYKLNNSLHWDELEDVFFSRLIMLNGVYIYFDKNNFLITNSKRLSSKKYNFSILSKVISTFRWIYAYIIIIYRYTVNIVSSK